MPDLAPFAVSLKMAAFSTLILLAFSLPVAYLLTKKFPFKSVIETLLTLPLVLPPTVLGFYILLAFSSASPVGRFLSSLNLPVLFTFPGILLGNCIHSLPFMIQPIKNGYQSYDRRLSEASYTLGKSRTETFFRVTLPSLRPYLLTGIMMTFIHSMGEFGVVLMTGGSIPGVTKVASIALYEKAEMMDFGAANLDAVILIVLSFLALFVINRFAGSKEGKLDRN